MGIQSKKRVNARFFFLIINYPALAGKHKNMDEPKHECPECEKREQEAKQAEQTGIEILVALMPLMTLTLFSNLGLF